MGDEEEKLINQVAMLSCDFAAKAARLGLDGNHDGARVTLDASTEFDWLARKLEARRAPAERPTGREDEAVRYWSCAGCGQSMNESEHALRTPGGLWWHMRCVNPDDRPTPLAPAPASYLDERIANLQALCVAASDAFEAAYQDLATMRRAAAPAPAATATETPLTIGSNVLDSLDAQLHNLIGYGRFEARNEERYVQLRLGEWKELRDFIQAVTERPRVETGPVQFGADWPGIFIRGDNALAFALTLQEAAHSLPPFLSASVGSIAALLQSCDAHDGKPPTVCAAPAPAATATETCPKCRGAASPFVDGAPGSWCKACGCAWRMMDGAFFAGLGSRPAPQGSGETQ